MNTFINALFLSWNCCPTLLFIQLVLLWMTVCIHTIKTIGTLNIFSKHFYLKFFPVVLITNTYYKLSYLVSLIVFCCTHTLHTQSTFCIIQFQMHNSRHSSEFCAFRSLVWLLFWQWSLASREINVGPWAWEEKRVEFLCVLWMIKSNMGI